MIYRTAFMLLLLVFSFGMTTNNVCAEESVKEIIVAKKVKTAVGLNLAPMIMPATNPESLIEHIKYDPPSSLVFDSQNRPYMINVEFENTNGYISTLKDGEWVKRSFLDAIKKSYPDFTKFIPPEHHDNRSVYGMLTFDDQDAAIMGELSH